jgi:uncharacterized protein YjbI with pentapeptide repeats
LKIYHLAALLPRTYPLHIFDITESNATDGWPETVDETQTADMASKSFVRCQLHIQPKKWWLCFASYLNGCLAVFGVPRQFVDQKFVDRKFVNQQFVNQQFVNQQFVNQQFVNQQFVNQQFVNQQFIDLQFVNQQFVDLQFINRQFVDRQFVN